MLVMDLETFTKDAWFLDFTDLLKQNNIELFGVKDLSGFKFSTSRPVITQSVSSGIDWFDVNISVDVEGETFNIKELAKDLSRVQIM